MRSTCETGSQGLAGRRRRKTMGERFAAFTLALLALAASPVAPLVFVVVAAASSRDPTAGGLAGVMVLFIALFAAIAVMAAPVLGALWAPFAALLCAKEARRRGLDPRRYAKAGALYSVLFFFPWVYLMARMRGRTVPVAAVSAVYVLLYVVWLYGSVLVSLSIAIFETPLTFLGLIWALISVCAWYVSLAMLIIRRRSKADESDDCGELLANRVYLAPFALALVGLTVPLAMFAVVSTLVE